MVYVQCPKRSTLQKLEAGKSNLYNSYGDYIIYDKDASDKKTFFSISFPSEGSHTTSPSGDLTGDFEVTQIVA